MESSSYANREFYVVQPEEAEGIISDEVLSYGERSGDVRVFVPDDVELTGWGLVKYEISRYRVRRKIELEDGETIYSLAICAAERYPAYFGGILPPRNTPWGAMVRAKKAAEGVYFVESVQCEWIFAVAFPIWADGLSEYIHQLGETLPAAQEIEEGEAVHWYFKRELCAPVIFELLNDLSYSGLFDFVYSGEALENELYHSFPEYVLAYNSSVLYGDGADNLVASMLAGIEYALYEDMLTATESQITECVYFHPEVICSEVLKLP